MKKIPNYFLSIAFILFIVGAIFVFYIQKNTKQQIIVKDLPVQVGTPPKNWKTPVSEHKAYISTSPYTNKGKPFVLYDFVEKKSNSMQNMMWWGGGALKYGQRDFIVSPDLLYTVYVDNKNTLRLISHFPLQDNPITTAIKYDEIYLSAWSQDSKKIIYVIADSNPEIDLDKREIPSYKRGFYLFNIETGDTTFLQGISGILTNQFIDSNRVFVRSQFCPTGETCVLDTQSYTLQDSAEFDKTENFIMWGQSSFSSDGSFWAFPSYMSREKSKIVLAKFPSADGIVIEEFTELVWPAVSPDGRYVAYENRGDRNQLPKIDVYDSKNDLKKTTVTGDGVHWYDNNSFVVIQYALNKQVFVLYDINTGTSTSFYP